MHPADRLRQGLAGDRMLEAVGVFDALTARLVEQADYDAVILGAGATSNFLYGLPDIGLLSLPEIIDNVGRVTRATQLPVVADLDDAGLSPAQVHRNVRLAELAGAAAVMVEDIDMAGKHLWSTAGGGWDFSQDKLLDPEQGADLVRSAVAARQDPRTLIIARTDAEPVEGIDAAVDRVRRYAEAGADLVFFAHMPFQALTREIIEAAPVGVVHFEIETPTLDERKVLADAGLKMIAFCLQPLVAAFHAFRDALEAMKVGETFDVGARNRALLDAVDLRGWSELLRPASTPTPNP